MCRLIRAGAALGAATVTFSWPVYSGIGVFNALGFIDVTTTASPLAPVVTVDRSVDVIRINGASVAGVTGIVELATVRFRVNSASASMLYVSGVELLGADFSNLLPAATATQYPIIAP